MNLRLVSSGDGPALALRDKILPLVREHGTLEVQRGAVRLTALRTGPWAFEHWTPFNDLSPGRRRPRATGTPSNGNTRRRTCPTGSMFGATGRRC